MWIHISKLKLKCTLFFHTIPIFLTVEVAKTVNCKDACKHSFAKTVCVQSSHINNTENWHSLSSHREKLISLIIRWILLTFLQTKKTNVYFRGTQTHNRLSQFRQEDIGIWTWNQQGSLKSIHFKNVVSWALFLSKLWYFLFCLVLKNTKILKEMKIAQLSS